MGCTHDCSSCGENCSGKTNSPESLIEKLNDLSSVKKVIAVVSGKGGVGKSMVTSMMAVTFNRRGFKTAVLDADVTGPSIPKAFGLKGKCLGNEFGIIPRTSKTGIDVMSVNLLLENETDPVIWRGPVIANTVKQFWKDVIWKDVDYMFVDMPPGTGDVPLTVFQSLPVDGIIVVTSPQDLVSMIVGKAVKMAEMMNVPIWVSLKITAISCALTAARNTASSAKATLTRLPRSTAQTFWQSFLLTLIWQNAPIQVQ